MFTNVEILNGVFPRINTNSPIEGLPSHVHQSKGVLKCVYSFAVNGGAVSTILLNDDLGNAAILPIKTIITGVYFDFYTAFTSGGSATVACGANTTVDLVAATAVASCTGLLAGIPVSTAATAVKLTAQRQIGITIAVAALTAGAANIFVEFVYSN